MTPKPRSAAPRPCRRHEWSVIIEAGFDDLGMEYRRKVWGPCTVCDRPYSEPASKRGRNNRKRGNSHELSVARKYGGEKVGPLGLPEDIRGDEYRTQVKTHQRLAPSEWRKAFAALDSADGRTPRLIVRFLQPGLPADDYIIIRGRDWLDRFGKDEEDTRDAA